MLQSHVGNYQRGYSSEGNGGEARRKGPTSWLQSLTNGNKRYTLGMDDLPLRKLLEQTVPCRAWNDWYQFFGSGLGQMAGVVTTLIVLASAILLPITDNSVGRLLTFAIAESTLVLSTLALSLVSAPLRQRNEARSKLRREATVDVTPNFPLFADPVTVSDVFELEGMLIVIPSYITNRSDDPVELDIELHARVEQEDGGTIGTIVPGENAITPRLAEILDRWDRRGGQLLSPLRIERERRAQGYLVFLVDSEMRRAVSLEDKSQIESMEVWVTDVLTNVLLKQVRVPWTLEDIIEARGE